MNEYAEDTGVAHRTHVEQNEVTWHTVLVGWIIGTAAILLLLLSVTGYGIGPGGFMPLRSLLWLWVILAAFVAVWYFLLRAFTRPT